MQADTAQARRHRLLGSTRVAEVMTRDVVTVGPQTGFKEIVRLFETHHISAVPVVERQRVVGIVSEADLLLKEEGVTTRLVHLVEGGQHRRRRLKAEGSTAAELMTAPAVTIVPEAFLPDAARLMDAYKVKRLPVVDGDTLVGICSRADLLRVFLSTDAEIKRRVLENVVEGWMWLDPATVDVSVRDGVVTLSGNLERRTDAEILVRLASTLESVVHVKDELTWKFDDHREPPSGGAHFE
jgi:CBS domain-containing protein